MSEAQATPLRRAFRDALPLFAAQGVAFAAGYGLNWALLELLDQRELADFGRMREALRWVCAAAIFGLPTGLLRLAVERREERRALFVKVGLVIAGLGATAAALASSWPWLRETLLLEGSAGEAFRVFVWKTPFIGLFAVAVAAVHAAGALRRRGVLEATERWLVLVGAVGGALLGGFSGLVHGSLLGSVAAALAVIALAWRRTAGGTGGLRTTKGSLRGVFRVGRARVGVQLLETLRPIALLQIVTLRGGGDIGTAILYGGMLFTMPLIAVPERLAQAFFPTLMTEHGEAEDVDARARALTLGLARVAVPFLLVAGLALTFFLPAVKEGAYAASVPAMWWLLLGVGAHGISAHLGYVILVRDRLALEAVVSAISLALMSALAWMLVPGHGATGGAAALAIALVVRTGMLAFVARLARATGGSRSVST